MLLGTYEQTLDETLQRVRRGSCVPYTEAMRRQVAQWLKRHRIKWAAITVLLYVVAVPISVWIFPDNNLWLAMLVLFSGLTASLTTLADLITDEDD